MNLNHAARWPAIALLSLALGAGGLLAQADPPTAGGAPGEASKPGEGGRKDKLRGKLKERGCEAVKTRLGRAKEHLAKAKERIDKCPADKQAAAKALIEQAGKHLAEAETAMAAEKCRDAARHLRECRQAMMKARRACGGGRGQGGGKGPGRKGHGDKDDGDDGKEDGAP